MGQFKRMVVNNSKRNVETDGEGYCATYLPRLHLHQKVSIDLALA
jgi:hypothetical protein